MIRFVTLLAVVDIPFVVDNSAADEAPSSTRSEDILPKPSFHLDGFLVTGAGAGGDGCGILLREDSLDALLSSLASV